MEGNRMKKKGSVSFEERVKKEGYCCPHAAIKLLVRPTDSIARTAMMFDVCTATVKNYRRKFREGELPCQKLPTCLRLAWLAAKKEEK